MTDAKKTEIAKREAMPVALSSDGRFLPRNLPEAIELAKLIAQSGMAPKGYDGNPGAVLVAIQMGAEIGLAPLAAIQNIATINGRPSLWGDAMLAVVTARPDCEDIKETLDQSTMTATCAVKRRDRSLVERSFSQADAKTAGLWGKQGPWTQYPRRMLQLRARAFALRDSFPDALRGLHCAEEVRDHVIDQRAEWVDTPLGAEQPPPIATEPSVGVMQFGKARKNPDIIVDKDTGPEQPHDADTGEVLPPPDMEF